MNKFVLVVEFDVKPECLDEFDRLIDINAHASHHIKLVATGFVGHRGMGIDVDQAVELVQALGLDIELHHQNKFIHVVLPS